MKIMHPVFLLIFGVFPLGASQALQRSLVQTTAHEHVEIPKTTFWGSLYVSAVEKRKRAVDREVKEEFNKHQTLIEALTDLTNLPKELIGLIALYNQATFFIGNVAASTPCSVEIISEWAVAVGCEDGSIYLVDVVEGRILKKISSHKAPVYALCFSPKYGELVSMSTFDGCIPTALFFEFIQQEKNILQIKVHAEASEQETKRHDETLRVWRLGFEPTFASQSHIEPVPACNLTAVIAVDPSCKNEEERKLAYENVAARRAQGSRARITRKRVWTSTSTSSCAETSSSSTITQEKDSTIYWYNDEQTMALPKGEATSIWSSDSEDFLGWSSGEIVVIDHQNCRVKPSLKGHAAPVRLLSPFITPAGLHCLASGSDDGTIKIWDIKTKQCLQTLIGHTAPIRAIKTRFESYLVSCSDDGTIRKWALEFEAQ